MSMDIQQSTVDRGHLNVLVWPVFGGIYGWLSVAPGITITMSGENPVVLEARLKEGLEMLWDDIDKCREDSIPQYEVWRRCWPLRKLPLMRVGIPCAPPYLAPGALEHFIEQAYSQIPQLPERGPASAD